MNDVIKLIDVTELKARIESTLEAEPKVQRPHFGCSMLGDPCARKLWYSFRWATPERHPGRILRLFRRGHMEEETVVIDLLRAGFEVTDRQREVSFGGHVAGSIDGIIEVDGVKYLLEVKTHNLKSFTALKKDGVQAGKNMHWSQMQMYMAGTGTELALYYAVCKDSDELYIELVKFDQCAAESLLDRANDIAVAEYAPPKISEDQTWYECKFCDHRDTCHRDEPVQVNCRTCTFAQPMFDGTWYCNQWRKNIPVAAQYNACKTYTVHEEMTADDVTLQAMIKQFNARFIG